MSEKLFLLLLIEQVDKWVQIISEEMGRQEFERYSYLIIIHLFTEEIWFEKMIVFPQKLTAIGVSSEPNDYETKNMKNPLSSIVFRVRL